MYYASLRDMVLYLHKVNLKIFKTLFTNLWFNMLKKNKGW